MQNPGNSETLKNALIAQHTKILEIIMKDDFYTNPSEKDINEVKVFIRNVQTSLRSRGNQNRYQVPASNLEPTIMMIDAIQKQDYNGPAITILRSSFCDVGGNDMKHFLDKHPSEFCKFYLVGSFLNIPSLLDKGQPDASRTADELDSRRSDILKGMDDPIAFIQTAFNATYNNHVKWSTSFDTTFTVKPFSKLEDAKTCVQRLKSIGIEECVIKPLSKGFRVEMPPWRVIEAMENSKQKQSEKSGQNTSLRFAGP